MFAVVSSGGKQYRVEPGSTVAVDRVASEPGASITFDRVLLIGDGDETTVGTPLVSGASVSGTVLGEELGPKLVIFKFKQKVKYRRRTGHRQHMSLVRIDEITASGRTVKAEAAPKPEPKAAATAEAKPKRATRAKAEEKAEPTAEAGPAAVAETSAPADEVKPKPRVSRARTAKPKAEPEAPAATEETTEAAAKPRRRAPARTKKAETAEE